MAKQSKPDHSRPEITYPVETDTDFESLCKFIIEQNNKPIERAWQKFYAFVNACVRDRDFQDPESRNLLSVLLLVRDQLTDAINERWTFDDILLPLARAFKREAITRRMKGLNIVNKQDRYAPIRQFAKAEISKLLNEKKEAKRIPGIIARKGICSRQYAAKIRDELLGLKEK